MKTFGEFVKSVRISKEISLRNFCKRTSQDPSNWSKIERGILPPPKSRLVLDDIAQALGLVSRSEDYNALFDLAAISYIPKELINGQELYEKLPVFFRTSRGDSPNREELERLLKLIEEE